MREQLVDLNFRIQFLLQLETGTQIELIDHWIKAERSPKHWQCYKFAKTFLKSLEKCLNYSIQTKISMDRSIWEHSTLTEFHQKIVESNGSLEDFELEKMRKSFQRLKRYRSDAEQNAPKAELFFDVVGSELVTLTELTFACQREDKKQEMFVKRSRVKQRNIIDRENSNWKIVGGWPDDSADSGFNSGFTSRSGSSSTSSSNSPISPDEFHEINIREIDFTKKTDDDIDIIIDTFDSSSISWY